MEMGCLMNLNGGRDWRLPPDPLKGELRILEAL